MDSTIQNLKIKVGTDNFEKMVTQYDIFVDKTLFIKEIVESHEEAILITYPRRWGKTLNLDMLKTFFIPEDRRCQERGSYWSYFVNFWSSTNNKPCHKDLFTGGSFLVEVEERNLRRLLIADVDNGKYMRYQGKYPVIFMSLKDVVANSLDEFMHKIKMAISHLYEKHWYLIKSNKLEEHEQLKFKQYVDLKYIGIDIEDSIKFLSELVYKHHGERVYILMDEYDRPINSLLESYLGQEQTIEGKMLIKEVTQLISSTVCSSVSKTNPALKKLIFTGIFDTTQKEFDSGCNNIKVFGVADSKFSPYFGFSEKEIHNMITQFQSKYKSKVLKHIKDWYNGYTMPIIASNEYIHLYTPWSVMNYLSDVYREGEDYLPQNYWSKSSVSTILQNLLSKEKCLRSELSDKLSSLSINQSYALNFDPQMSLFKYDWFTNSGHEEFFLICY